MLTHDYLKGTITADSTGEIVFNVIWRDGVFDFVANGQLAAIVEPCSFVNYQAGEYWSLAQYIEHQARIEK